MAARRLILIVACVSALTTIALWERGCGGPGLPSGKVRVKIAGETFALELAADPASRETGLMNRTDIPKDGGMLFVFPEREIKVQSFWMKNCPIDIDIVYLDSHGFVTATHRMKALPRLPDETEEDYETRAGMNSYPSGFPAQFAIELKSGSLDRLKVKTEDHIDLDLDRLKALARKADES